PLRLSRERLLLDRQSRAPFDSYVVEEPGARAVARVIPAPGAGDARAEEERFSYLRFTPPDGHAAPIEAGCPVQVVHEFPARDVLPVGAVDHPGEAALVGMNQELARAAVDR